MIRTRRPGTAGHRRIRYLVLGAADQQGVPWVLLAWYAHARYRGLLGVETLAQHRDPAQVSIVIFDSSVQASAARAVYIIGAAEMAT